MAYTVEIDAAAQRGTVRMYGTVTGAEVIAACRELFEHPAWDPAYTLLWDDREISALDVGLREMGSIAQEARYYRERLTVAAVVVQRPSVRAVAETLIWFTGVRGVALFTTIEEAEAWLARQAAPRAREGTPS
jgi:hypothetical protein